MAVISHNLMAMNAQRQFNIVTKKKEKSSEKLSSGYKINRSADDAAGLSISEKMRNQIRNLNQATRNVEDGIHFCSTAEGALNEVHGILKRMGELSVQAANDVNGSCDREAIRQELLQLKDEINQISKKTEFNGYKIFRTDYAVEFSDNLFVVDIYDAKDGDPNDLSSYGGIIINHDYRVPWSAIDANMVYTDPDSGKMMFHEGSYTYSSGGFDLKIECKEGETLPNIKASFSIEATSSGIQVADSFISWNQVFDEKGNSIIENKGGDGLYHFQIGDVIGSFAITNSTGMQDVIDGINNYNQTTNRTYVNKYDGYYRLQAVDIKNPNNSSVRVNNSMKDAVLNGRGLSLTLGADALGVWINDVNGQEITGSRKTWGDIGLNEWMEGNDVSDRKIYEYSFNNGEYNVKYTFDLMNETSKDSVIAGINGAKLNCTQQTRNNKLDVIVSNTGNVKIEAKVLNYKPISIEQEALLNRDFDSQFDQFATEELTYNADTNKFSVQFYDAQDGTDVVVGYETGNITTNGDMMKAASTYTQYLTACQVRGLVTGDTSERDLESVIGSSAFTQSGYLSETINGAYILNNKSTTVPGSGYRNWQGFSPTVNYPCASIDFSGLNNGSYSLYDLLGTGFNSTCNTCNNHYSVLFVYGGTTNTCNSNGKSIGYSYDVSGTEKTLQVDIKSMLEQGISTSEAFTDALIDVFQKSGFANHYQQYVSDGSRLYICDDRSEYVGSKSAKFDGNPYQIGEATGKITLNRTGGSSEVSINYTYDMKRDFSAMAEFEEVDPVVDPYSGTGSGLIYYYQSTSGEYRQFDPDVGLYDENGNLQPDMAEAMLYKIKITNTTTSWDVLYDNIMAEVADAVKLSLSSTGYEYLNYRVDENENGATSSNFDFYVEENKAFWIQSGANAGEAMSLEWERFNAYTLGFNDVDISTHAKASDLINVVRNANLKISEIRSGFGAYVNRMEYTWNNNQNYAENLASSESHIRDTDMEMEIMNNAKADILSQIGQAMIAQANQQHGSVLKLLQ